MSRTRALALIPSPRAERLRSSPRHAAPVRKLHAVRQRDLAVIPRVVPIYWDPHFVQAPADVAAFDEFLRTLFCSSWMSGLEEFGVAPAELLPSIVPTTPRRSRMSHAQLKDQLVSWIQSGAVSPKPKKADRSLIYLVLSPLGMDLSLGAVSAPTHVSGYHDSARLEPRGDDNLRYAVVPLVSLEAEILDAHSRPVCHELAQAFIACARRS